MIFVPPASSSANVISDILKPCLLDHAMESRIAGFHGKEEVIGIDRESTVPALADPFR